MYAIRSYYEDFIRRGGVINLKTVNNKVRFEINRLAGERRITSYNVCYTKLLRPRLRLHILMKSTTCDDFKPATDYCLKPASHYDRN